MQSHIYEMKSQNYQKSLNKSQNYGSKSNYNMKNSKLWHKLKFWLKTAKPWFQEVINMTQKFKIMTLKMIKIIKVEIDTS